jgi:phytoene synthase
VNVAQHPEQALALSYAPVTLRAGVQALFTLDETLGQILRTTREPMVGQMRLTWWHEALAALDVAPPPAQPVLQALAAEVITRGVSGTALAEMIDGWDVLLEPDPLDRAMLDTYAKQRGSRLFVLAGKILGAGSRDPLDRAGAGWALADLARHSRDALAAALPHELAVTALQDATRVRWSGSVRSLGAMTLSARMDLATPVGAAAPTTSPARIARLAWHRLSGR